MRELDRKILEELRERVDEERFEHSRLVAEAAKEIAERYRLDSEKAFTAGLAHDIAKRFSDEENRYYIEKYGLDKELLDEKAKNYVHADVGAVFAKERFGLDDEICRAIKYHTIPDVTMTDFDKAIFLADKIGRDEEILPGLREAIFEDLDKGMKMFLREQEKSLEARGIEQHPRTKEFMRNYEA